MAILMAILPKDGHAGCSPPGVLLAVGVEASKNRAGNCHGCRFAPTTAKYGRRGSRRCAFAAGSRDPGVGMRDRGIPPAPPAPLPVTSPCDCGTMGRELFEFAHVRYESHVCPVQDQSGRPRVRRAPGARTRSAPLHRSDAGRPRHRQPRCGSPFPRAVARARLAGPLHHPRPVRRGRCPGSRRQARRPHPRVRRLRSRRHLGHHRAHPRFARPRRAGHAVHPAALRRGLRAVAGRHHARVLVRPRLHRHGGLRHRLQGGGRGRGGGGSGPGYHRPPRAGGPCA